MYSLYWLRRSRTSSLRRSSTASSSEMTSAIFSATRSGFDVSMVPGVRLLTSCLEMYATNSLASSMLCARIRSLSRMGYDPGFCRWKRLGQGRPKRPRCGRESGGECGHHELERALEAQGEKDL